MSVRESLKSIPGLAPRPAQLLGADIVDLGAEHIALEAATGSGKSWLAYSIATTEGGLICMHSNGLVAQYQDSFEKYGVADYAVLAGARHAWCPKFTPENQLPLSVRPWLKEHKGSFIGSGIAPPDYLGFSVVPYKVEGKKSPCNGCSIRIDGACPLWNARNAAVEANVVVTNAAMLAVAMRLARDLPVDEAVSDVYDPDENVDEFGEPVDDRPWPAKILRERIIIDEADSCEGMIRQILIPSITIRTGYKGVTVEQGKRAHDGPLAALDTLRDLAARPGHQMAVKAQGFLDRLGDRTPEVETTSDFWNGRVIHKTVLQLPNRLNPWWEGQRVVAMSATFTEQQARWLGLEVKEVHMLPSLDVSNCTVTLDKSAPKWVYDNPKDPASGEQHDIWADHVSLLCGAEASKGPTLGLFQSRADLAICADKLVELGVDYEVYLSDRDRPTVIQKFRDGEISLVLGCFAGAGRGIDLPGDLLQNVVIARVPQRPPASLRSAIAKARWKEDSCAAVVQAVGRACRFDGDRGEIRIVGGFGDRYDIRDRLAARNWKMETL